MRSRAPSLGSSLPISVLVLIGSGSALQAGMTVYDLNDLYRLRFQELSFFLLLTFASAWVFKALWRLLAKDFSWLPVLRYPQALALTLLVGAGMLLILTMISGIREVLTPGAWRRQGSGYALNSIAVEQERVRSIEVLRDALIQYSRGNEGRFPPHDYVEDIPLSVWKTPDPKGTRYLYVPGRVFAAPPAQGQLLAAEPSGFGERVKVILSDGGIDVRDWETVETELKQHRP